MDAGVMLNKIAELEAELAAAKAEIGLNATRAVSYTYGEVVTREELIEAGRAVDMSHVDIIADSLTEENHFMAGHIHGEQIVDDAGKPLSDYGVLVVSPANYETVCKGLLTGEIYKDASFSVSMAFKEFRDAGIDKKKARELLQEHVGSAFTITASPPGLLRPNPDFVHKVGLPYSQAVEELRAMSNSIFGLTAFARGIVKDKGLAAYPQGKEVVMDRDDIKKNMNEAVEFIEELRDRNSMDIDNFVTAQWNFGARVMNGVDFAAKEASDGIDTNMIPVRILGEEYLIDTNGGRLETRDGAISMYGGGDFYEVAQKLKESLIDLLKEKGLNMDKTKDLVLEVSDREHRARGYIRVSQDSLGDIKIKTEDQFFAVKLDADYGHGQIHDAITYALESLDGEDQGLTYKEITPRDYENSRNQYRAMVMTYMEEPMPELDKMMPPRGKAFDVDKDWDKVDPHKQWTDRMEGIVRDPIHDPKPDLLNDPIINKMILKMKESLIQILNEKGYPGDINLNELLNAKMEKLYPRRVSLYREHGIPDVAQIPEKTNIMVDKIDGAKKYYISIPGSKEAPVYHDSLAAAVAYGREKAGMTYARGDVTRAEVWSGKKEFDNYLLEAHLKGASRETLYVLSKLYDLLPDSSSQVGIEGASKEEQQAGYALVVSNIREMADIVLDYDLRPDNGQSYDNEALAIGYAFLETEGYVKNGEVTPEVYGLLNNETMKIIAQMELGAEIKVEKGFMGKLHESEPAGVQIGYSREDLPFPDDKDSKPGTFYVRNTSSGEIMYRDVPDFNTALKDAERLSEELHPSPSTKKEYEKQNDVNIENDDRDNI